MCSHLSVHVSSHVGIARDAPGASLCVWCLCGVGSNGVGKLIGIEGDIFGCSMLSMFVTDQCGVTVVAWC